MQQGTIDSSARLRPYLPRILMSWLQEAPGTIAREVEGTVVFVDISGFTKMSERLARHGKVGAGLGAMNPIVHPSTNRV